MDVRFPRPLQPGDRIGVTSPSSGVEAGLQPRLDVALRSLRDRGYDVVVGNCMNGDGVVSATKQERASELTNMLCDPQIRAVVPPWGGELAIDLLDQLDWDVLAAAEPTWVVGFSDLSTLLVPLTLRLGWATLHGSNLMDTPYSPPDGLLHWIDVASGAVPFTQSSPGRYRADGRDDYRANPAVDTFTLDTTGTWSVLGDRAVDATGLLIGGCIETMSPLAGTPYADVPALGRDHELIVYLEAADQEAYAIGRALHGLRLADWFENANAILIGRTAAPDNEAFTQREAVEDALGDLKIPVVLDVECGHVAPYLPLVNGAQARVVVDGDRREITQNLG